jgi:predicted HTH domain antitoxin
MQQTAISISDNVLLALNMPIDEVVFSMRKGYAAQLYQDGKLTLGQAAELCGMEKYDFTAVLSYLSIPVINYSVDDFNKELETIGVSGGGLTPSEPGGAPCS